MFNHWFPQEDIPGSVTKGGINFLKKGDRYVLEELDHYRHITRLNTELKILAWVEPFVISDLNRPEQNFAVKGRSM